VTSTKPPHESTADSTERPRGRRSPLAVGVVAAAVLIAGGGGAYFATSAFGGSGGSGTPGDDGRPPPLALGSTTGSPDLAGPAGSPAPSAPPAVAPGEPHPRGVTYRARGELPRGPGNARVYRPSGTVAAADVARLARAFGVAGTPRSAGASWKVGTDKDGSGPLLQVTKRAPGSWTFTEFGAARSGDDCTKGKSCPSVGSGDGGDAVSEAVAKKAAAPVLKALGQDDADIDTGRVSGATRVVNADPVIGGLPTYGWSTGIQVDADGRLTGGAGQLIVPERGDSYPVIGAAEALKELNKAAVGAVGAGRIGGCATAEPLEGGERSALGKPSLPCAWKSPAAAEPVEISGAVFGLAARSMDGQGALVPSWLFEAVPGGSSASYTVTHPAVAPEFLRSPAPGPAPGPTSAGPGTPSPQPHKELPGGPGSAGTGDDLLTRGATSYSVEGRTLTLRFTGGVCDTYAARADESGTAVKVKVIVTNPDPERICVAMAKERTAKVTLDKPLGDRQVVDGATGRKVERG
jgi:hypothetical protein